jgi:predicted dehydrogenase
MGNVHANQYRKMPDVELVFYDRDPEKAHAYAERWHAESLGNSEEVISRADVVDVCLPTDMHLEYGLKAIAAGRAVFMEKPMARTLEEGAKMARAAESAGVPLMPGQVVRFFPEFRKANEIVQSGRRGKPAAIRTRRGGPAPKGSEGWFMDHRRSGGVLLDLAIHDFDWLRWTIGEVKSVFSRSVGIARGSGPDYALTTMTFDSGAVSHTEATWMDPGGFRVTFEVCGSEGMMQYDSRNSALRTTAALEGSPPPRPAALESPMAPNDDPYYRQIRGFLEAVAEGSLPPVSAYDGWMALSIALAAVESASTGKAVAPARSM